MKTAALALAISVALLASILLVNALRFTSRQIQVDPAGAPRLDEEGSMQRLSRAIRFRTVSYQDPGGTRNEEFVALREHLERSYPLVHARLTREIVGGFSLLYTWTGRREDLKPVLLAGHLDTVPVDPATEAGWEHPPFEGRIADGHVWGRGAMDDKSGVLGILEAVELLLAQGFEPGRTIHLAFGHDEEVGGHNGAAKIATLLRGRNVAPEYVLDEGLVITDGVLPVPGPVALVGIAEKGSTTLELSVRGEGGHSSIPPPRTAIGILAAAIDRLEEHPMHGDLKGIVRQTLDHAGPEMPFGMRLALANLWLFGPVVERRLAALPGTNAAMRTTTAVTMIEGGVKENALPTLAKAVVNFRLAPGDTIDAVTDHVRRVIDDPRVGIRKHETSSWEPSAVSDTRARSFQVLQQTVRQVFPDAVVAPALVPGATDARHYAGLSDNIYRFLPQRYGLEDFKRYHGINERISADNYARCVRFYHQLIGNSAR